MLEEHVLHFQIQHAGAGYSVELAIDGRRIGQAPFDDAWCHAGETGAALQRIEDGVASVDDLQTVGVQLWTGLIAEDVKAGPIRAEVGALRKRQIKEDVRLTIRIEAPPEIHLLPWEALYDPRQTAFLGRDPRCSVLRHPSAAKMDVPDSECRATDKLRILIVIPAGSGLNVAAEWERLRFGFEPHKHLLEGGAPTVLQGRVTYDDLCRALENDRYDIVHFIGHGWVDDQNKVWIRMNSANGGEENKIAEVFTTAFQRRGVQFVFMNCCHGAVPGTTRAFAGLAPALLTLGVPAVLAMRYAIPDSAAARLSSVFYSALLAGPNRGRVDVAAQEARNSLIGLLDQETSGARLLATPVLFVAPGTTKIFELPETANSGPRGEAEVVEEAPRRTVQAGGAQKNEGSTSTLVSNVQANEAVQIFVSAADADKPFVRDLTTHLAVFRRRGEIEIWHRGNMPVSVEVRAWTEEHLSSADIVVLMLSPDFMNDDAYAEMERALVLRDEKGTRVVPVLVRAVRLEGTPVAGLVSLPRSKVPIALAPNKDATYADIASELTAIVTEVRQRPKTLPSHASRTPALATNRASR